MHHVNFLINRFDIFKTYYSEKNHCFNCLLHCLFVLTTESRLNIESILKELYARWSIVSKFIMGIVAGEKFSSPVRDISELWRWR